jgi:hypothetical protein
MDSQAWAGRIYDRLVSAFHSDLVYMDVDDIEPGLDFFEVIEETLQKCHILLVVIGRNWLNAADEQGRRIDNPEDLVRHEIRVALRRNIRVIPILVDGARMPRSNDLPGDIAKLIRRNGVQLHHDKFNIDVAHLIDKIQVIMKRAEESHAREAALQKDAIEARHQAEDILRQAEAEKKQKKGEEKRGALAEDQQQAEIEKKVALTEALPDAMPKKKNNLRFKDIFHRPQLLLTAAVISIFITVVAVVLFSQRNENDDRGTTETSNISIEPETKSAEVQESSFASSGRDAIAAAVTPMAYSNDQEFSGDLPTCEPHKNNVHIVSEDEISATSQELALNLTESTLTGAKRKSQSAQGSKTPGKKNPSKKNSSKNNSSPPANLQTPNSCAAGSHFVKGTGCVENEVTIAPVQGAESGAGGGSHATGSDVNDEVRQPGTELYWRRCPVGQNWNGSRCSGRARKMTWHKAKSACPSGYRLPTRQEFVNLLGGCESDVLSGGVGPCNKCSASSNCSSIFISNTDWHWSSSSNASNGDYAWYVSFDFGYVYSYGKDLNAYARCVRKGP